MKLFVMLMTLSAYPGAAVQVSLPAEPELAGVTLEWNKRSTDMIQRDGRWYALIGVDLDVKPGEHTVQAVYHYTGDHDGRRDITRNIALRVAPKDYPTTKLEVAPKYVELSKENLDRSARDRKAINAAYATASPQAYWTEPFAVPIPGEEDGRNFGHRRVFNDQPRAPHSGADLTAATGTPILATNRGKVILTGDFFFNGKSVFVDHGMGVISMYLHLSEITVAEGQMLERGEQVGLAGATGRVTGPHLHWGMKVTGARVDPFSLPGLNSPLEGENSDGG